MKLSRPLLVGLAALAALLVAGGYGLAALRGGGTPPPAAIGITPPPPTATVPPTLTPAPTATPGPLRVYVSGAVMHPAVYELPPGSILDDAVRAAGGFAPDADTVAVNLAQAAVDGMQVYVPVLGESLATPPVVSAPAPTQPAVRMGGVTVGGLININTATQADLEMLPGVGPATAEKIIAHREANGPFATIEAIMDVPGIGEAKFAAMKDLITVGP
ncbi:helix-hairpin-helix domain-containing protein [Promineifilum sp.]|uniref:helix-hairpin-helix domain-containing protein n=1 Tax=Promineifilum sp. TaxID=2664178 RepID=UPI0035B23A7D